MPIESWIEKDQKRIHAIVYGEFSANDILKTIEDSIKDPAYEAGFDVLSDHTKIEKPITIDQLKRMVFKLIQLSEYFAGTRFAVVTHNELSTKMMAMLSEHIKRVPMEIGVFATIDKAQEWLNNKEELSPNKAL